MEQIMVFTGIVVVICWIIWQAWDMFRFFKGIEVDEVVVDTRKESTPLGVLALHHKHSGLVADAPTWTLKTEVVAYNHPATEPVK